MAFQYILPKKIIFGSGKLDELPSHLNAFGRKVFVVSGKSATSNGTLSRIYSLLENSFRIVGHYEVHGEPTCEVVDQCRDLLALSQADVVIGIGGGSPLDVAKAAAGLHGQIEETSVYLNKKIFEYIGLPFVGIPTTSGTGSEITLNSVLLNPVTGNKASIAHEGFQSVVAIIDPELSYTMPKEIVASTGMDALTHAIESHVSSVSNEGTRLYTSKSIELIGKSLIKAVNGDRRALNDLSLGSLYAAMGFAQTGVGIAHAISHPLGAIFHIPHGIANAILLKEACRFNYVGNEAIYDEVAKLLECKDLYLYLSDLLNKLPIPNTLIEAGYREGYEKEILEMTFQSRSLKKNPREASKEDVIKLIERCKYA